MKKPFAALAALALLGFAGTAVADSISEVWECTLKEDKTVEQVQAVNSKWLAFVNGHSKGGVTSAVGRAMVGSLVGFVFIDTYPDIETWASVKKALDDDSGDEFDQMFGELSTCTNNSLWRIEPTK